MSKKLVTSITHIANIERALISKMFNCFEAFKIITEKISEDDFTISVHKDIYSYFKKSLNEKHFNDFKNNELDDEQIIFRHFNQVRKIFKIGFISFHAIVKSTSKISHIEIINNLLEFSRYRKQIIDNSKNKEYIIMQVVDEYGLHEALYSSNILSKVVTSYSFRIANEICIHFDKTFENYKSFINVDDNEASASLIDNVNPNYLKKLVLKRNINFTEKINNIFKWADEFNLDNFKIIRQRGVFLETKPLFDFSDSNITYIPDELFEVRRDLFLVSFANNQITTIPRLINLARDCNALLFCNNKIEVLPKELFQLVELESLYLHNNRLTLIPIEISKLSNLKTLSISNNDIKEFPIEITQLKKLESLDIENTLIEKLPVEFLKLENLSAISFDEQHFEFIIQNKYLMKNVNTINLAHSSFNKEDDFIKSLNIQYCEDSKWIDDKDLTYKKCIKLSFEDKIGI